VVELAGSTDLTLTAARIEVTGKLGSSASPLGDLSLTGGTEIGGAIDLAGKLVLEDKVSKTANLFLGAIHAGSMEVISAASSLEFRGLVQLSGTGVFSGISSQGIKFNDQLTAQTLAFNSGLVSYPVTLFGSTQTTDSLVAARFDNGGATRLGDDAKDQFHFAGGLNQTGVGASIQAVGTILTDGTPVNLTRLEAAGLPLVIVHHRWFQRTSRHHHPGASPGCSRIDPAGLHEHLQRQFSPHARGCRGSDWNLATGRGNLRFRCGWNSTR